MGLLNMFKKTDDDIKEETEEDKEDNTSIINAANYMLSTVKEEDIDNNSFKVLISDLTNINNSFKEYTNAFSKNKNNNNSELYQITGLNKAHEIVDFFNDPNNKDKVKDLKKLGFNPATIMMTIALCEIEKDVNDIKEISKKILSFLESESEAKIESSVKMLNELVSDYKYNWSDEQFVNINYNQVKNIKKEASDKIIQYQKIINSALHKKGLLMTNKTINDNQSELEKNFSYYRLSLYVYSFSTFMEIMLLENFKKEFLISKKEELEKLSNEYSNIYQIALDYVSNTADKSIQGNVLSLTGEAGKTIGGLLGKVESIKEKKVDSWFDKQGDSIKTIGQDMKEKFKTKFTEMADPHIKMFTDKIELISNIYNNTKNIYFDKEKIYLEMVK